MAGGRRPPGNEAEVRTTRSVTRSLPLAHGSEDTAADVPVVGRVATLTSLPTRGSATGFQEPPRAFV